MPSRSISARHYVVICLAGAVAISFAPPIGAADPPAKKRPAKTAAKTGAKILTRDELRACLDEQDRIKQVTAKVRQDEASLEQPRREVEQIDSEIARKLAALEPDNAEGKQALQAEEARRNELADAYNARLRTLRDDATALESDRKGWVERCSNKAFDERDEIAIQRERQRAAGGSK